MIRKCSHSQSGRNSGDLDVAFQLFESGMVWDGNLASKTSRDYLVAEGYAVRHGGMQAITGKGTVRFLLSPCVWVSAFRRWKNWKRNPFVADVERIQRAMR